jgi:hypothetical protein
MIGSLKRDTLAPVYHASNSTSPVLLNEIWLGRIEAHHGERRGIRDVANNSSCKRCTRGIDDSPTKEDLLGDLLGHMRGMRPFGTSVRSGSVAARHERYDQNCASCVTSRDLLAGQNLAPRDSEPILQAMRKPHRRRDENLKDLSYDEY